MKTKDKKLVVHKPEDGGQISSFIEKAIASNVPAETLERLFALYEKGKAEQAREAFVLALSQFQGECPVIKKTKKVLNKDGRSVRYVYAPIDSIVEQIKKPVADAGLSYRWEVKQGEGLIKAICIVTHVLGHSESSDFDVPIDTEGYMTAPQKFASALTFAKRYSLLNALGISTGDEDTDASDVNGEKDAKTAKAKIIFLLRTLGEDTEKKESIEKAVERRTKLKLIEKNYEEIVARLEVSVREKNADTESKK